ncbi:hypothetical protein GCM10009007_02980 [Formosimonas limnophila]|uniref:Uncharacterized protein n=1 Tax=Formosimonas limnophila TaxID=1384487 RepID=A0A8J3FZ61_9BURK|nr:hypothetical protein GCM10009007_02980 [Formosimonas limnophila]
MSRHLEVFARSMNDLDDHLPKSRGRCFDIGSWGGCGINCAAFIDGECEEPQEIDISNLSEEHGEEEAERIIKLYKL